jgi:exoribonuclease-2
MMDLRTKFIQVLENEAVVADVPVADDENEVEAA